MFPRLLTKPTQSILLFGPRGTGKTSWIKQNFPNEIIYDLLDPAEALRLAKSPSDLYAELKSLQPEQWVIIDEIQKVPQLMDVVHKLIEKNKLRFILSGSSARKLKKTGANLLAGRALLKNFFPLVSKEVNYNIKFPDVFTLGMLPLSVTGQDPQSYLRTYAQVYLNEEIKAEALTRNIGNFARFLEIAARQNSQITNVSNIARDAEVSRQTVQGYFEVLIDTLMGSWLPAWKLKRATKQVCHPKFYFFDPGVCRALTGRLPYDPTQEELGPLIETFIIAELRAFMEYSKLYFPLYFWRTPDDVEVDILYETNQGFVAIEIKATKKWKPQFNKGLVRMSNELKKSNVKCLGVFLGERQMTFDNITVYPVLDFLKRLWNNEFC